MDVQTFQTSLGPVPFWGGLSGFSPERPLLLVIRGAFPDFDQFWGLVPLLPQVDIAFAHLPGCHSPHLSTSSIAAFAKAFDEAAVQAFEGRTMTVMGASMGGLVALAMRSPVGGVLGLDPPLSTAPLWPLREGLRRRLLTQPALAPWIWGVFGVSATDVENRDYRWVLEGLEAPAQILVGGVPLAPERPILETPSLVSEEDAAFYRDHPGVRLTVVPHVGHNLPRHAQRAIVHCLVEALPSLR